MDGSRFEDFTRRFSALRSRRSMLRLAASGLLAVVVGQRRSENVSAAVCPVRIPNPDQIPSSNGCGTTSFPVSGIAGGVDLTPACNNHDLCYNTCNQTKNDCDQTFLSEMRVLCAATNPTGTNRDDCNGVADVYYRAVVSLGGSAYEGAQAAACICCNHDEVACGDVCCAAAHCHGLPGQRICCDRSSRSHARPSPSASMTARRE
jgi:hypothetical protein